MNHMLNYIAIDVVGGQPIRVGGGAKGEGVALVEPGVFHERWHLDSLLWLGGEKLAKKVFATCYMWGELWNSNGWVL